MQPAVVNEYFVEQGAGSKTVRRYASVCWCVCGCARIYILIRNCLCVYFMHQLVIHFIDVCSIVTAVRCRFTPAVELWIFGYLHLDRILCMFSLTFVAILLSFPVLLFVSYSSLSLIYFPIFSLLYFNITLSQFLHFEAFN